MWGKVIFLRYEVAKKGITPTHVGKSKGCVPVLVESWDHPHPCGEK